MSFVPNSNGNGSGTNIITLPSGNGLTWTGYTFGGWNTETDGTGTNYAVSVSFTVTGNVTLYANWEHTHIWGEWVLIKAQTVDEDGELTRTCTLDPSHTEPLLLPKTGPFHVYNIQTLEKVGKGWDGWTMAASYIQIDDIDLKNYGNWTPIARYSSDDGFFGNYEGGNYTISNLTINRPNSDDQGLFGYVGNGGVVKNLRLTDINVTGQNYVGGLVGTLSNESSGTMVANCSVTGNVTGVSCVGGVVGQSHGKVTNSYSMGTVSGSVSGGQQIGGLVGSNVGTVTNCYSTSTVTGELVGGLVGSNSNVSIVSNSYTTGNVSGTNTSPLGSCGGGVVGQNIGTLSYCYATGDVSGYNPNFGESLVAGIVGYNSIHGGAHVCKVTNSVALNKNISDSGSRVVTAINSGPILDNYARSDMAINLAHTPDPGHDKPDGTDITATQWNSAYWWEHTVGFDPNVWNLADGSLPTLKDMPGNPVQNPVVK